MHRLTEVEKVATAKRYLAGESSGIIAYSFGVTDVAILNHLKKMGVKRRGPSEARRVYPIWDQAFSILTQEAAYWVGFLMADGCVHDASKVSVGLAEKDYQHLQKLRSFLHTETRPIYIVPTTKSRQLKIHSEQIVKDLVSYGVVPRKSYCAKGKLNVHRMPSFWLGVLDGDGTIGWSKNRIRVRVAGTKQLLTQLVSFLVAHKVRGRASTFKVRIGKSGKHLHEVTLCGQRALNFLRLLYADSPVYLSRKRKTAVRLGLKFSVLRCSTR